MQKHVNLVDLVKSFPTNIFLQNLASIQKRTGPIKIAHLAEKSENGSISNLSTKAETPFITTRTLRWLGAAGAKKLGSKSTQISTGRHSESRSGPEEGVTERR